MSKDSLRGLVQLVSVLGEVTVARANQAARDLVNLTGLEDQLGKKKLAKQVQAVAQEILQTAQANRAQVAAMVRSEVESALARADVARVVDVESAKATTAALFGQVEDLHNRLRGLVPGLGGAGAESAPAKAAAAHVAPPAATATAARKRPTRRSFTAAPVEAALAKAPAPKATPTKKAPARKAPATKAPARTSPAKKATTTKATTTKAPARAATKAVVTKAPAKKSPVRKTTAKKAAGA